MFESATPAPAIVEEGEGALEIFHTLTPIDGGECEAWDQALENQLQPVQELQIATRYRLSLVREPDAPYDGAELVRCDQPFTAARFLHQLLESYPQEVVGAILLNTQHQAMGHVLAYLGTLCGAYVEPRGILAPALLANAASVVMFHNHPSGSPEPSRDDRELTKRIVAAGEILGVKVLDHIILGESPSYVSLYQNDPW